MNKAELINQYEEALVSFHKQTPCLYCGGDVFTASGNVAMLALYLFELAERWKASPNMSVAKATKAAKKAMERHFNKLSVEATEKLIQDVVNKSREEVVPLEPTDETNPRSDTEAGVAAPASTNEGEEEIGESTDDEDLERLAQLPDEVPPQEDR